jgi:hypothetical protein
MTEEQKKYHREYRRRWRLANPERAKEYEKRSRERNRDHRLAYAKQYNKKYWQDNKEKLAANSREYYVEHSDKIKEQAKLWREENPEQYQAGRQFRRDRLFEWWYGEVVPTLKCAECGISDYDCLHFHHREMRKPGEKLRRAITTMLHAGDSREAIEAEMQKCTVLCANCHNREHARLRREAKGEHHH